MDRIVVITHRGDAHIPFVRRHLSSRLTLIDPSEVLNQKGLSYAFDGDSCQTVYGRTTLRSVKSVWYRKPSMPDSDQLPVPGAYRQYAHTAITNHIEMLRAQFPQARWVSDFYAINKARNKAWQLHLAASLGLSVPKTLITSDPQRAMVFLRTHSPAIVKSQSTTFPTIHNRAYFFFAKRFEAGDLPDLTNLHLAPAIFQEAIDAVADIRLTVVGGEAFAAIIRPAAAGSGSVRDWRFDHSSGGVTFQDYDKAMPRHITRLCKTLVAKMGLVYGAIDLVVDQNGTYWFLEINPNGQWAFVEEETGQPIGKAIAMLLEGG